MTLVYRKEFVGTEDRRRWRLPNLLQHSLVERASIAAASPRYEERFHRYHLQLDVARLDAGSYRFGITMSPAEPIAELLGDEVSEFLDHYGHLRFDTFPDVVDEFRQTLDQQVLVRFNQRAPSLRKDEVEDLLTFRPQRHIGDYDVSAYVDVPAGSLRQRPVAAMVRDIAVNYLRLSPPISVEIQHRPTGS